MPAFLALRVRIHVEVLRKSHHLNEDRVEAGAKPDASDDSLTEPWIEAVSKYGTLRRVSGNFCSQAQLEFTVGKNARLDELLHHASGKDSGPRYPT